ncbi:hypothetical protein [Phormidesmis priestleyi]
MRSISVGTSLSLEVLRSHFTPDELLVVRQGNRLSIMPVTQAVAKKIMAISSSYPQGVAPA